MVLNSWVWGGFTFVAKKKKFRFPAEETKKYQLHLPVKIKKTGLWGMGRLEGGGKVAQAGKGRE